MIVRLTGRTRYRVHRLFFGREVLVLQVEEQAKGARVVANEETLRCDTLPYAEYTTWRDATLGDITTHALEKK